MIDDRVEENDSDSRHCMDCDVLTDALRDMEQQCREAEDDRCRGASLFSNKSFDQLMREEDAYQARLSKLQHRRDCALEVLMKHQSLEHRS
jgi:hypothetical protein